MARRTPTKKRPASAKQRNEPGAPRATDEAGQRQERSFASQRERERRFVAEYFANGLNVPKAMIAAGFSDNYSTACSHGSRLMRRPSVLALIAKERAKEGDSSAERRARLIAGLEQIIDADPSQLFDDAGNLQKITQLDDSTKSLIAGLEVNEMAIGENAMSITRKVKIKDQLRARELLAKITGDMAPEQVKHSGKIEVVEIATFTKPKAKK